MKKVINNKAKEHNLATELLVNTGVVTSQGNGKGLGEAVPDNSWTRFCVICSVELVEKIKHIATVEGFTIREVVEKSLSDTIGSYERKKGKKIELKLKRKPKKDINEVL